MFTDSHCHLNFPELKEKIPEIRQSMREAQVTRALCICTTLEEFDDVHKLATSYHNFWCTVGVHPDSEDVQEPCIEDLVKRASLEKVVGIGETGLDYYRLRERTLANMEWQRERFRVHIRAACITGKPLVVHTRSASNDTIAILKEESANAAKQHGQVRGVFHCFTETQAVAKAALDLGFYISFSGVITFKNAGDIREVARFVPLDRLLIETDSPYLAPMPYRGKTNSPSYVPFVAKQLAEIKQESLETIAKATSQNFERLFTGINA
ncbi:TatD family hydrolase [Polaromonas sp. CG_9.11]|uniref:TatD family hydrolase n=1 Tax=Polaromonas sp. CG_9.11 TaxID=2787730 RepID=UPI0018CBC569|nr:TatD family hydrolase [Polaromonas sp. CG_9.11]MBG6077937.1 TatD DNase family protein [Polaromonas sp. CG_9.11]